jgi:hypothetical protein
MSRRTWEGERGPRVRGAAREPHTDGYSPGTMRFGGHSRLPIFTMSGNAQTIGVRRLAPAGSCAYIQHLVQLHGIG